MDWPSIGHWVLDNLLAVATAVLALATCCLAGVTWRGVRENKKLIESTKHEADLLWGSAVPHVIPESIIGNSELKISYAAGTIPARAIQVWVGEKGEVRVGSDSLMSQKDNVKSLALVPSRAGSEPPQAWDKWLRRDEDPITHRVVMRWEGPEGHVTERAWWIGPSTWEEVDPKHR